MDTTALRIVWLGIALAGMLLAGPLTVNLHAYGGGGGDDTENGFANIGGGKSTEGGGGSSWGGPEGIKSGTADISLPLPPWDELKRQDWERRQDELSWESWWAGWAGTGWAVAEWGAIFTNYAGKAAQFGLNFVPGVGKMTNIGLDAARGGAEGYAKGLESGLSQEESMGAGGKTAVSSGLFSAFTNKFGFGKNYGKAIDKAKKAKTAAQITRTNKKLGSAIMGTTADEAIKEGVGNVHSTNVVQNTSPQAKLRN